MLSFAFSVVTKRRSCRQRWNFIYNMSHATFAWDCDNFWTRFHNAVVFNLLLKLVTIQSWKLIRRRLANDPIGSMSFSADHILVSSRFVLQQLLNHHVLCRFLFRAHRLPENILSNQYRSLKATTFNTQNMFITEHTCSSVSVRTYQWMYTFIDAFIQKRIHSLRNAHLSRKTIIYLKVPTVRCRSLPTTFQFRHVLSDISFQSPRAVSFFSSTSFAGKHVVESVPKSQSKLISHTKYLSRNKMSIKKQTRSSVSVRIYQLLYTFIEKRIHSLRNAHLSRKTTIHLKVDKIIASENTHSKINVVEDTHTSRACWHIQQFTRKHI